MGFYLNKMTNINCVFCHLPTCHKYLGDLLGPNYASTKELINYASQLEKNESFYKDQISEDIYHSKKSQIVIDKESKNCYIPIPKLNTASLNSESVKGVVNIGNLCTTSKLSMLNLELTLD